MGFFDVLKAIIPRQPSSMDAREADYELQNFHRQQEVLGRNAVIDESVNRAVRDLMANVEQQNVKAKNVHPYDPNTQMAAQTMGDALPSVQASDQIQTYKALEDLSKVPVITAIHEARIMQLLDFARPQRHKNANGFKVQMRDHNKVPSTEALKRIAEIEAWISTVGNPDKAPYTFADFIKLTARDSLTFDQACSEKLLDKYGRPAKLVPTDAKYIRMAQITQSERNNLKYAPDKRRYIQTFGYGEVAATWSSDNFMFGMRRQRTSLESRGYGWSELQQLAQEIWRFVKGVDINTAALSNGLHATGVLVAHSNMTPEAFKVVEDKMRSLGSGASNAHRMQFMQLSGEKDRLEFVPFSKNSADMEFSILMSFTLKVICGVYQMDPAELNFIYGAEQQKSSMQGADPMERLTASRERGIRPLLRFYEDWLNREVVHELDPDFEMLFCGLDNKSPLVQAELDTRAIQSYATINEIRAQKDLPAIDDWTANVPANPVTLGIMAQERQLAQQQAQQQQVQAEQAQAQQQQAQAEQQGALEDRQRTMAEKMLLSHHEAANAPKVPDGPAPPTEIPEEFADDIYNLVLGDFAGSDEEQDGDIDPEVLQELQRSALPKGTTHEDIAKGLSASSSTLTLEM